MTIEIHPPPGLSGVLNGFRPEERLKNRQAQAIAFDVEGNVTGWKLEGKVFDVYKAAVKYDASNPSHIVRVIEDSCTSLSVDNNSLPNFLQNRS